MKKKVLLFALLLVAVTCAHAVDGSQSAVSMKNVFPNYRGHNTCCFSSAAFPTLNVTTLNGTLLTLNFVVVCCKQQNTDTSTIVYQSEHK